MAQPSSRSTLIDYCKRQLGAPLLEINIADEQTEDLLDDAIQYFQERHFNGVIQTFLKYKVRQVDIDRSRGKGAENQIGIVTTTTSSTVAGISTTFSFEEDSNYLQMPDSVIGVNKLFHFDGANTVTNNMFSVKYQLFLNDVAFNLGYAGILNYAMTKSTAIGSTAFPVATFSVGIDTTPSSGYGLTISLGSTATRSINAGRYVYDVLVGSGMTVYRIVDGNILVRGGVSSAP